MTSTLVLPRKGFLRSSRALSPAQLEYQTPDELKLDTCHNIPTWPPEPAVVLCTCLSHTPETTHTRRIHTLHGAAPPHRRTALKPQQPRDHHATHQNRKEPSGGPLSQSPPALSFSVSPVVSVSTSFRYTVRTRKEARTHRHVPLSRGGREQAAPFA